MYECKHLLVLVLFKLIVVFWSLDLNYVSGKEASCWNNDNECNIKTELFHNLNFSNGISMQIDCRLNLNKNIQDQVKEEQQNDFQTSAKQLLLRRFVGIQSVMLDGCQTHLNTHTYGLEFLPICANVTKVSIRHFHMDILIPLNCDGFAKNEDDGGGGGGDVEDDNIQLQLEYLNVQFNEISAIDAESFKRNCPHLRNVLLEGNSLKYIHGDTFKSLGALENLRIVNEPVLMLKSRDLFKYTSVVTIYLKELKQMTSEIFCRLPETLQSLYVADTQLDNDAIELRNSLVLRNLTIKNCALREFTLNDVHSTVKRIDLSGNVIKLFTAYENDLKELSLSNNQLGWVHFVWFKNLTNLETLILKQNHIQILSLNDLLLAAPMGNLIDLSDNRLQSLQDYENSLENILLSRIRLKCDRNPWDCLWLHEFAHQHPEKFRILQYEKFISKINVNGLQCVPAEKPLTPKNSQRATTAPDKLTNVSTYTLVYGNPWDFKRNQRAEALIIVFMLPLGIALLFLLLYMWIYCQKMFHLSYYQDFSCMRRSAVANSSQRFDVVRPLPSCPPMQTETRRPLTRILDGSDEGYEVPINGVISECNCMVQHKDMNEKCKKTIHITYEQLPTEEPHQIYEEIIHVEGIDQMDSLPANEDNECCNKPTHDNLSSH